MTIDPNLMAHVLCGMLIALYAWGRFNTPLYAGGRFSTPSTSTRQRLYWLSCLGYIISTLVLFAMLVIALHVSDFRQLLNLNSTLPAPLIATLVMTTLLPSVPLLKKLDTSLLDVFLIWGAIPAEVTRRVAAMTPEAFSVIGTDLGALKETYGETLAGHLRTARGEGADLAAYRLTRAIALYDGIRRLTEEPGYAQFFATHAEEFQALERSVEKFIHRSSASLTVAAKLRAVEAPAVYEELMQERRDVFAKSCREMFDDLARFLARAVLRSEPNERGIVDRLRKIGFSAAVPMNQPDFPLDCLALLSVVMFVYLTVVGFVYLKVVPHPDPNAVQPIVMALKITMARLGAVAVTVLLIQRYPFFQRVPGAPHRYFAYLVCGVIGGVVSTGSCLLFALCAAPLNGSETIVSWLHNSLPPIIPILSAIICPVLAFCCNDWAEDRPAPAWLRAAEAAGCAGVAVFGMAAMILSNPMRFNWPVLVFPPLLAAIIGFFVPHIYRRAMQAARAGRTAAVATPPASASEPRPADAPIEPVCSLARLPEARAVVAERKAA